MRISKNRSLWIATALLALSVCVWAYHFSTSTKHVYSLVECSQGEYEIILVPQALCRTYLLNFRGSPDDVATITRDGSLVGLLSTTSQEARVQLLAFLIEKDIDVNALDERVGVSPLHTAVLDNNMEVAELLLRHGANRQLKDRQRGLTALEFALQLQGKPDQPDRTGLISLLQNAAKD